MTVIQCVESSGLSFLQFDTFRNMGLAHGLFSRHGGVSRPPYDSLNTSFGVGDSEDNVVENRERIKRSLGVRTLVSARQVHGNGVYNIMKPPGTDVELDGYDALVTGCNIALMIQQADCQAVLLYSPERRVIGIAHAGWRGSVSGIIGVTVGMMVDQYGADPKGMLAAISPSLGPCCAEFVHFREELPEWMQAFQSAPNHFDFHLISKTQLVEAGLRDKNISFAPICTRCNQDYFSYRRDGETGRFASVIALVG